MIPGTWFRRFPRSLGRSATTAAVLLVVLLLAAVSWPGGLPLPSLEKVWSISIYTGPSPLALRPGQGDAPVLTAADVTDVPARFVADPFILREGLRFMMFFEVLDATTGRGEIATAESADGLAWSYGEVVLREPFHLSYPYVFAWQGRHFMVPESSERREVRLYEARSFPSGWTHVATLLEGEAFTDSCVLRQDGKWWLFTYLGGKDRLALYVADELTGPWRRHPASPILMSSSACARPGGRIVRFRDRLLRFAQQGVPRYGSAVWAYEITELTEQHYAQRRVGEAPVLAATKRGWNAGGMHQIDALECGNGNWIAAVDGYRIGWMLGFRRLRLWPGGRR